MVRQEPTSERTLAMRRALEEEGEQRALLMEYVRQHMIKEVDYGVIPGTKKDTLFKPGAEKLVELFRCTPSFRLMKVEEDFERGFFNYIFRVRLTMRDSGAVVAEGFGSCNSFEGRYRWRDAQRTCPECGKAAIIRGKQEYGGGWLCFRKKDGCGAKFMDGDEAIEGQPLGRVENDDIATLANTILKMAKKRALVDGAIALARCSDMFTQDEEDMETPLPEDGAPPRSTARRDDPPAWTNESPSEAEKLSIAIGEAQTKADLERLLPRLRALPEAMRNALKGPYNKKLREVTSDAANGK